MTIFLGGTSHRQTAREGGLPSVRHRQPLHDPMPNKTFPRREAAETEQDPLLIWSTRLAPDTGLFLEGLWLGVRATGSIPALFTPTPFFNPPLLEVCSRPHQLYEGGHHLGIKVSGRLAQQFRHRLLVSPGPFIGPLTR